MNRTTLPELAAALRTLGSYGHRLDPDGATPEQLAIVGRAVEEARRLLVAANGSGCAQHPQGPTDPTAGGACLLCRTRRFRPVLEAAAAAKDVLHDVTELGEEQAAARHGARAVARALAAAGRGTYRYLPADRPRRTHDEDQTP